MKKRITAVLCALFTAVLLLCAPLSASASYPLPEELKAKTHYTSAVVVYLGTDMSDDMLIYEKNPDERLAPAALVRVMVGMYALKTMEEQNIDPTVATGTYTESIFDTFTGTGLSTIGMEYGDVWKVEDLLSVSMICTAADAVGTLTTTLAGSQSRFVEGMNALAAEIGCTNTHFTNVYGLDRAENYTSARDMYTMLRYATLHYPEMITMLSRPEYSVTPVIGEPDWWDSTNNMLRPESDYYYSPLVYGRSGLTETGSSCASVARDDGIEFMAVVMDCKDSEDTEGLNFTDTMTLFRWVYNAFSYQNVVSKGQPISRIPVDLAWRTDSVALVAADSLEGMLRNDLDIHTLRYDIQLSVDKLTAPVEKGQICGSATVYDGDKVVGTIELGAADAVAKSQLLALLSAIKNVIFSVPMLIIAGVLVLLLISYVVMSVVHNESRRKNKRKRVKQYK